MFVWLVRHALAMEADLFPGPDCQRPLVPKGRKRAKAMFDHLATVRHAPEILFTSEAVRARQTAKIFAKAFRMDPPTVTSRLNPGARFQDIRQLVAALPSGTGNVALVGHEPDFSGAAAHWTGSSGLDLVLKKSGIIELELCGPDQPARLRMVLPPDLFG